MNKKIKFLIAMGLVPLAILYWPAFLGGETNYIITYGTSMLPTILHGSMVITKQEQHYFVDDIVSFTQTEAGAQKIIVHRIIEEVDDGFIIQGDNNPRPDPGTISPEEITGKVVVAVPYVGYGLEFVRNPLVMIVIAVAIMALQSDFKRRSKKNKKKLEENQPKKDLGLFYGAIGLNITSYMIIQLSLSAQITPKVDMLTQILMRMFLPSFASTLAFAAYFIAIIGIYYFVKTYHPKPKVRKKSTRGGTLLLADSNPVMLGAQMFWIMFIMIGTIHLIATIQDPSFLEFVEQLTGIEIPFDTAPPRNPAVVQYEDL